jgi:hypothetical protein
LHLHKMHFKLLITILYSDTPVQIKKQSVRTANGLRKHINDVFDSELEKRRFNVCHVIGIMLVDVRFGPSDIASHLDDKNVTY